VKQFQKHARYSREQVDRIQSAYRALFPRLTPGLSSYWNFERKNRHGLLPYLTTNFLEARYEQYEQLSERAGAIEMQCASDAHERAARLLEASEHERIGFSIGLSPWTDCSLERTWSADKEQLLIILAHDWYPITVQRGNTPHPVDVPLRPCGLESDVNGTPKYHYATPPAVLERKPVVLFMNLVPDYRPPGSKPTGKLRGYEDWIIGFDAVLHSVAQRYTGIKIISWGSHTWRAMASRVREPVRQLGIMKLATSRKGEPLTYVSPAGEFKYLPTAHPSDRRNFDAVHAMQGHLQLGLG
jgi:hypothetical protein